MKKSHILIFIAVMVFSIRCSNEINPENTQQKKTFTFIVNDNYLDENERKWVVIYDKEDTILAETELANNQEFELEWLAEEEDNFFNVYIYVAENDNSDETYNVHAYSNIEPAIWYLNGVEEPEAKPGVIGATTLKFSDFSPYDFKWRFIQNLARGRWSETGSLYSIDQHYDLDKIWISLLDDQGIPIYKFIDEVGLNETYEFSLADMAVMESSVEYDIPGANYSFAYLWSNETFENEINPGFNLNWQTQYEPMSTIKIHYPGNLFSQYYLDTYYSTDNSLESMIFKGASLPEQFSLINIDESISSRKIEDYQSTITGTAGHMIHSWEYSLYSNTVGNRVFRYHHYAPVISNYNFTAPALPEFFADLNTLHLDLEKLEFGNSDFGQLDDSNDYGDYIDRTYVNPGSSQDFSKKLLKRLYHQE